MALVSNSMSPDLRIYKPGFDPDCPLLEEVSKSRCVPRAATTAPIQSEPPFLSPPAMTPVSNSHLPDLPIFKPRFDPYCTLPDEVSKSRSELLHKIHPFFVKARKLLKCRSGEALACSSLCVGLLDPVDNLVISNLICCKRKRKRISRELPRVVWEAGDLERRSLDGMVAFLTRLFPDLSETKAVRYLLLADADALVAARIVVLDVGMERFFESGPAVMEMALLKCAALAARHPDPDQFVAAWRNISSRIDDVLRLVKSLSEKPPSHDFRIIIQKLHRMLNKGEAPFDCERDMSCAWQLAATRRLRPCIVPFSNISLLKRTLHDALHTFYLQALARLPAGELRSRFHRSLLKAGYCYGLLDPVSNIIINTIWYEAAFPPTKKLDLDIIGTGSLQRMENRSLHGLVSFLCMRYHGLNFEQAVRCLLQADANLLLADAKLDDASFGMLRRGPPCHSTQPQRRPDTSVEQALFAAATAACHPNPAAQVKLLAWCKDMLGTAVSLLQGSEKLSSQDVQQLATLLSPESSSCAKTALPSLFLKGYPHAELAYRHTRISKKVNALLNAYEQMPNGDPKFELHMICGVNDRVSGPTSRPRNAYHQSHVNFIATPKSPFSGGVLTFFFAEISHTCKYTSFCCPVALPWPCAAQVRCLYCEFMGARIVHPIGKSFHGGESEFEKMAYGNNAYVDDFDPVPPKEPYYNNSNMNGYRAHLADGIDGCEEEDRLYDDLDGKITSLWDDRDLYSMSMEERLVLLATC